jgi:eukaryotic-like serine/threonine-protein kinase
VADPPSSSTSERSDRTGSVLAGRYRFERRLAVGGMAEVWEATDQVLDRLVAIKVLHPHLAHDDAFVERFRREAIAAARLTHPSIVAIYDTYSGQGEEEGVEAIVMELVRGISLRRHLDERGVLHADEAVAIAARVAEALETAHRAGLVHRDIKPANILLCDDERVMVADFGIAKVAESGDHTKEGTMLGTAKYLAPEQVSGNPVDARTDLYSLGIVLYEMVCGRVPFEGDNDTATVLARLHSDPTPPRQVRPDVPPDLEAVILRALRRDPDERPASAAELRSALLAGGSGLPPPPVPAVPPADATFLEPSTPPGGTPPVHAPAPAAPPPAGRPREARWVGPVLLILVIVVALGVAGVLVGRAVGNGLFGGDETDDPSGADGGGGGGDGLTLSATSFDPAPGDGSEHDEEAALAVDGDAATAWETEGYSSREFGNLKDGVGLVLTLSEGADLGQLLVSSPTTGWAAEVYVADSPAADLAGWGEPVDSGSDLSGEASFDLDGSGSSVLLWITDLGDGEPRVEITEAVLTPG